MKERAIDRQRPIVAYRRSPEVAQPGDGAFDDPAPLVAPQRPAILRRRLATIFPMRSNQLDAAPSQLFPQRVAIVTTIPDDPRTFLPQAGPVERLVLPSSIRVDAGVAEGDEIGTSYDPMIAKLIAHAPTRAEALDRLADALAEAEVGGVTTNLPFLRWLVAHPVVRAGRATTAFLTEHPPLSLPVRQPAPAWAEPWRLNLPSPPPAPPPDAAAAGDRAAGPEQSTVSAPMPGTVIRVLVAAGDRVLARQPLVVLEAMKMETPLASPYDGTVRAVHVAEGDRVAGGTLLVELEE